TRQSAATQDLEPDHLRGLALACAPLPFLTFPVLFRRHSTDPRAFRGGPRKLEAYFGCARGPASVRRSRGPRTRAVHGPRRRKPGPLVTPIFASSTWALASARQGADFAVDTAPPAY